MLSRMKSKAAYIVIAHGSREKKANTAFQSFVRKFQKTVPKRKVYGAFLELAVPSIPQALERALGSGCREIFILPLMFFPGRHVKQDIPRLFEKAKADYPDADFHYAGALADHPMLPKLLAEKAVSLKPKKR